jgi:hypothetical protein
VSLDSLQVPHFGLLLAEVRQLMVVDLDVVSRRIFPDLIFLFPA